ncbi:hypothetical protein CsatA_027797 [Cannabis sativa]
MDSILGIKPINFSDAEEEEQYRSREVLDQNLLPEIQEAIPEPLSPKSSLRLIKQHEEIRKDFVHFLDASNRCSRSISQDNFLVLPVLRSGSVMRNLKNSFSNSSTRSKVKITNDDIKEEIDFWNPSIVCYVLGANPPLSILEGFARRM